MKTKKMKVTDKPLTPEQLSKIDAYWRAANYLSVGQICLYNNRITTACRRPGTRASP